MLELVKDYQVFCAIPDNAKENELRDLGCEIVFTPMSRRGMNPLEDYKLYRNYLRLLKDIAPDAVISYTVKPNIYGGLACRKRRIPYLATVSGLGSVFHDKSKSFVKNMVICLYRSAVKKAACVFFQNTENQEVFTHYRIKGKKSRLVFGTGVNLRTFRMEPYPKDDKFRFLFVGRVMKEKGIDEFLAAAEALASENVRFQIVGFCEEDYQDKLDRMEVRGLIDQLGFSHNVQEVYLNASAVILPSYHEGLSTVLMEASSTGRPVIAADVAGCREVFDDGHTGFGCIKGDSDSLIQAIKKFMAVPLAERALMGRKAREKMGKEFDREKVISAYLEEIKAAIE
ncbi:MAG: glycosyltransferase family 4 protein [Lachnospiraceae bacterium]|nr:glycosyltransferase family 4 protein [Lachnospiraceae bacterium]